jgi:hypothetical protein
VLGDTSWNLILISREKCVNRAWEADLTDCTTSFSPTLSGLPSQRNSTKAPYSLRNFSLPLRCRWCLQSSGALHSVCCYPVTEAAGHPIGAIFKDPTLQEGWILYRRKWVRWAVSKRR